MFGTGSSVFLVAVSHSIGCVTRTQPVVSMHSVCVFASPSICVCGPQIARQADKGSSFGMGPACQPSMVPTGVPFRLRSSSVGHAWFLERVCLSMRAPCAAVDGRRSSLGLLAWTSLVVIILRSHFDTVSRWITLGLETINASIVPVIRGRHSSSDREWSRQSTAT